MNIELSRTMKLVGISTTQANSISRCDTLYFDADGIDVAGHLAFPVDDLEGTGLAILSDAHAERPSIVDSVIVENLSDTDFPKVCFGCNGYWVEFQLTIPQIEALARSITNGLSHMENSLDNDKT